MTTEARRPLAVIFYGGLSLLLLAILFRVLPDVLPDLYAGRIQRNSEGVTLLLIIAPWIQYVRPRLVGTPNEWRITAAVAVVSFAIGLVLFLTDPINQIKTLNESFLAASVLIPYVQLRRPIPLAIPLTLSLGLLVLIIVGHSTEGVTLTAEMLGALILTPVALDVVDRAILDPSARPVRWQRFAWYAFLVAGPAFFWATNNGQRLSGRAGEIFFYAGRTTEIFLCLLGLCVYFAVLLGRDGRHAKTSTDRQSLPADV